MLQIKFQKFLYCRKEALVWFNQYKVEPSSSLFLTLTSSLDAYACYMYRYLDLYIHLFIFLYLCIFVYTRRLTELREVSNVTKDTLWLRLKRRGDFSIIKLEIHATKGLNQELNKF